MMPTTAAAGAKLQFQQKQNILSLEFKSRITGRYVVPIICAHDEPPPSQRKSLVTKPTTMTVVANSFE
jgi:hypothetical protein